MSADNRATRNSREVPASRNDEWGIWQSFQARVGERGDADRRASAQRSQGSAGRRRGEVRVAERAVVSVPERSRRAAEGGLRDRVRGSRWRGGRRVAGIERLFGGRDRRQGAGGGQGRRGPVRPGLGGGSRSSEGRRRTLDGTSRRFRPP